MPVDLSIAIVSYNVRDQLAECLSSVEESGRPLRQEIIVVDNASHDGSAEMVRERFPQATLIRNSENVGFARACNQALRVSQGRYLLLLNPDTVVVGDCLPRMAEFIDRGPDCGAATCRVWLDREQKWVLSNFEPCGLWWQVLVYTGWIGRALTPRSILARYWKRRWGVWQSQAAGEVESIQGNFCMVRRSALADVGLLDERFFMYFEDADWSRRLLRAGWKLCLNPAAGVIHHTGQSSKGRGDVLGAAVHASLGHYLRKSFGWTGTAAFRILRVADLVVGRVLRRVRQGGGNPPGPVPPGVTFDLQRCPKCLSWPAVPGATRYLVEVSLHPLFLGGAARFVSGTEVELPQEEFRKPGFQRAYWRVVPFCGDEPMASWIQARQDGPRLSLKRGISSHRGTGTSRDRCPALPQERG